jgi:hypothetical protein
MNGRDRAVPATYGDSVRIVRDELADDPTVDITTIGRRTGTGRRIEILVSGPDIHPLATGLTSLPR